MNEKEFGSKILTDEAFRAEFKKDPKGVMRAHGIEVPEDVEIEVVESTPAKHFLVLPPILTGELTDEQLTSAQGGTAFTFLSTAGCGCTVKGATCD